MSTAELARAVCLRGIVGTFSDRITFPGAIGNADDFHCPWEELPESVRQHWMLLAGVVHRIAGTPGWEGALSCLETPTSEERRS